MHTHKKKWQWVLHGTIVAKITLVYSMSWRQRVACCDLSWEHAQLQLLDDTNYCLPEHICKTLCRFGSYKEISASMWIFKSKQIPTPPLPRDQGALAPPPEASPVSHPGALSFPKDLGDSPVQSLQGHQPLGCMVQAGLVTFQIALLWRERASYCHGHLGTLWCLSLSGVGTWQPLGKMVSTSPLCQEAADWGPVYKVTVWQPRPGAQELCHQETAMEAILPGQSLLEGTPPSLPALE